MPTIRCGSPSSVMVRPTSRGIGREPALPQRIRDHGDAIAARLPSSARKPRPVATPTPIASKNAGLTLKPCSRSGSVCRDRRVPPLEGHQVGGAHLALAVDEVGRRHLAAGRRTARPPARRRTPARADRCRAAGRAAGRGRRPAPARSRWRRGRRPASARRRRRRRAGAPAGARRGGGHARVRT